MTYVDKKSAGCKTPKKKGSRQNFTPKKSGDAPNRHPKSWVISWVSTFCLGANLGADLGVDWVKKNVDWLSTPKITPKQIRCELGATPKVHPKWVVDSQKKFQEIGQSKSRI